VATEPTPRLISLGAEPAEALPTLHAQASSDDAMAALSAQISRRSSVAMPVINIISAVLAYVFIAYVVPLPGHADSAAPFVIAFPVVVLAGWIVCDRWSRYSAAPIQRWLERGGEPDEAERDRTVRYPLHEAGQVLVVWSVAGIGFGVMMSVLGAPATAGVLVAVMSILGGLGTSALAYFASERIMRPAVALALQYDVPARPALPGIATRIYLAWEFGTGLAVAGGFTVAIVYLAGAHISPHRMAATVIFLGAIAMTVGLVTLLIAIRSVSDPIKALRHAMRRVEAGETDVTVDIDDGSEIGLLQAGFNRMLAGLRERDRVQDLFGRHVGEEVARSALGRGHELGGELREAAVLFVDVIGSTAFSVSHQPREVVETLNRFFEIVFEVVTQHGGWVNKFEGDGALCAFGAPTAHPDPAGAALAAARGLQRRLRNELDGLEAAIGLSAGTVVAGNIGAAKRYEYTVIGDPVNEAARLTELAKGHDSRLLASEAIVDAASPREAARWVVREPVLLRGRDEPTRIAEPG
jgi:adenylate cyclase